MKKPKFIVLIAVLLAFTGCARLTATPGMPTAAPPEVPSE